MPSVPVHRLIALVVGAGGTSMAASYAMQQLGVTLVVYNRTVAKAQEVAGRFGGTVVTQLIASEIPHVDIVIGTVPADSGFTLPTYLLQSHPVIVLDAAYKPSITPLLQAASTQNAMCIQGFEMLVEQAVEQFSRWNKTLPPPYEAMRQACLCHVPEQERL